eukprot:4974294-Amphidinium_carterae.1
MESRLIQAVEVPQRRDSLEVTVDLEAQAESPEAIKLESCAFHPIVLPSKQLLLVVGVFLVLWTSFEALAGFFTVVFELYQVVFLWLAGWHAVALDGTNSEIEAISNLGLDCVRTLVR